ncbi:MAG: hypothetical protein L6420_07945 [Elusimicrobia bacterium]|nr:hypothetical protein [Elusimicrobiota bacterium]
MSDKNQKDSVDELERSKFADSYIGRIRTFQNQLLIWGVSLNYVVGIYVVKLWIDLEAENYYRDTNLIFIISLIAFFVNSLIGYLYSREHNIKYKLVRTYKKYLCFRDDLKDILSGKTYTTLSVVFWILEFIWIVSFFRFFIEVLVIKFCCK